MIIDIHTHAFPESIAQRAVRQLQQNSHIALYSDGTEADLLAHEKQARVDLAVVQPVATNPDKVEHMNDAVIKANRDGWGRGALSFGAMHPAYSGWKRELERIKEAGVPGIKLHPPYEGIAIDDCRAVAVLRKCKELGLIVLIHSGRDIGLPGATEALPEKIRRALDAVGPMKLIAAHMGGWGCWKNAAKILPETGIYVDTAFSLGRIVPALDQHPWSEENLNLMDRDAFCEIVQAFGADRVLFGTDSPWADPKQEVEKIRALPLTETEKEEILGANAEALLKPALVI